jgi:oligosaccharide repeat unit polymerase
MFLGLVALYLVVFFVCAVKASPQEGFWSPVVVFGITAFYYYLSVPLELYLRGQEVFATYPIVSGITPETRNAIGIAAVLALFGFIIGHRLSGMGRLITQQNDSPARRLPRSLKYVAIGAIAVMFLLYRFTIFEKLAYNDANERRFNDPVFGYLTRLCLLLCCLSAGVIVQKKGIAKAPAIVFAALAIAWGIYTSDKNPLLQAALGLSAYWVGKRSGSIKYLYFFCAAAVLTIAALPMFSAFRTSVPVDFRKNLHEFSVQNTDAKGPMISLVDALEDDPPRLYGSTYLFDMVAWVPRAVWPDRPNDLAQDFALDNIPKWEPGMGLGYSLLAEAYLNFGYPGIFLQYFGIAFILGRIWCHLWSLLARHGAAPYWRASLAVTYFEIIAIMHRAPSSGILQSCIFELLIPFGAFFWLDARRQDRFAKLAAPNARSARRMTQQRAHIPNHSATG